MSGVIVLLALLFLAPLFSDLPKPVLAALIIEAVVMGMMDVGEMRRLRGCSGSTSGSRWSPSSATLLVGVLAGVVIGIVLSLLWLVGVATHPQLPELGQATRYDGVPRVAAHPEDELDPGVAVLRIDSGLFFASCEAVEDRVRDLDPRATRAARAGARLRGDELHRLTGDAQVAAIARLTREAGLELQLARLKDAVAVVLDRDGCLDLIGRDHLHGNVDEAVRMIRSGGRD